MPNTLGHLGIQTLLTRGLLRGADVKWIWLAAILPDLPWIGQRVVRGLVPEVSPIDLRLYATVQSALLFCLIFSAALACFSRQYMRCFAILALGSVLHLLLDAAQTKWGNGVVLLAPFRWELTNFRLFWPESLWTLGLSGVGAVVAAWALLRAPKTAADLVWPRGRRLVAVLALLGCTILGPVAFMPRVAAADLHGTATLRPEAERTGRALAFDRARLLEVGEEARLSIWTGEVLAVSGADLPAGPATVSLEGEFVAQDRFETTRVHVHAAGLRDFGSYLGLFLVLAYWIWCLALPSKSPAAEN